MDTPNDKIPDDKELPPEFRLKRGPGRPKGSTNKKKAPAPSTLPQWARVRIAMENPSPCVDEGRYAVKAIVGDIVPVEIDIWKDGHDLLKAAVLFRKLKPNEWTLGDGLAAPNDTQMWQQSPLTTNPDWNDRWRGSILLDGTGPYAFTFMAWTDAFGSWKSEIVKKIDANQEVKSEAREGAQLLLKTAEKCTADGDKQAILSVARKLEAFGLGLMGEATNDDVKTWVCTSELQGLMDRNDLKADRRYYPKVLPVWSDRERAIFGAWYELFPRSLGPDATHHGTLRDVARRIPKLAQMGFDVLYMPPIHPIGLTARKGKNNTETCVEGDVGSPWAIGSKEGGHLKIHPNLGTFDDFDEMIKTARQNGMEIALDFAIQCSPDHPWVKEHPKWFNQRPDGTIKYAENPPKKYQDIYPINFDTEDRDGLYNALRDVLLFWVDKGVKIFRVDNPHTKAIGFWEWVIAQIQALHPDVLFLAEAFTKPKRMALLAKSGFTQSYSYFTWRVGKKEIEDYAQELFLPPGNLRFFLRPNFFANTPDILHEYLQKGGRPAFLNRFLLAATLGASYGIYSGFEVCENVPLKPGSEEYLNSEKYEIRHRDYDAPGNLNDFISRVNQIRHTHKALHRTSNLNILKSTNSNVMAYAKTCAEEGERPIVVILNLDPNNPQESSVTLPCHLYGKGQGDSYEVTDLLSNKTYTWTGETNYVRLDPHGTACHIFMIHR